MTSWQREPIGDPDRVVVIAALRQAAETGRLSPHELDERVAAARAAGTAAELRAVTQGLLPVASSGVAALGVAGYRADDPLVLAGGFTRERRGGVWVVPPFIRASAVGSSVKIDCLRASTSEPVIDLTIAPGAAAVVLVLPEGWAVNTDRLRKGVGSVSVKVPREPAPGCPLFLVHGNVGLGRFTVRPGSRLEKRRASAG